MSSPKHTEAQSYIGIAILTFVFGWLIYFTGVLTGVVTVIYLLATDGRAA